MPADTASNKIALPKSKKASRVDASNRSEDRTVSQSVDLVFDQIPQEYIFDPVNAEPILYYLPKAMALANATSTDDYQRKSSDKSSRKGTTANASGIKFPNFRVLLSAAEEDIRLHRARVQAGKAHDASLLRSYKIETDITWLARQQRLNERMLMLSKLDTEREIILNELRQESTVRGLTAAEKTQVQLARWQRALELFVYSPPDKKKQVDKSITSSQPPPGPGGVKDLELLGLMENLLEGIAEVRSGRVYPWTKEQ
jgi:hypothetical protein